MRPYAVVTAAFFAATAGAWAQGRTAGVTEVVLHDLRTIENAVVEDAAGLAPGSDRAITFQSDALRETGLPVEVISAATGIRMRLIPAGTFRMGTRSGERGRDSDEGPAHEVTLRRPFYIGKFEITQRQWVRVMGANPSEFADGGPDAPVERITWETARAFVRRLCRVEGVPEGTYRLPTEAEWEYACRAGTATPFCWGDRAGSSQANFDGDFPYGRALVGVNRERTARVGTFRPNAFGLHDMHGNVWEWCGDYYGVYPDFAVADPTGPSAGEARVARGGCWFSHGRTCRSGNRYGGTPGVHQTYLGVRVVRELPLPPKERGTSAP